MAALVQSSQPGEIIGQLYSLSLRGAICSAGDSDGRCTPWAVRGNCCPIGCSSECRSGSVCLELCATGSVTKDRRDGGGDTGEGAGMTGCSDGRFAADVDVLGWLFGDAGCIFFIPMATSRR